MARVRLGALDRDRKIYPLSLFGNNDDTAAPIAGPIDIPQADFDTAEWNPARIRAAFQQKALPLRKDLLAIGDQMFAWLKRGAVGAEWARLRAQGAVSELDIVPPDPDKRMQGPGLSDLPWELTGTGTPARLFQAERVCRFHAGPAAKDDTSPWPLRMLVVVGVGAPDGIGANEEVRALKRGLLPYRHSIDLEVFTPRNADQLYEKIHQDTFLPHIFHFIGHSGPDRASGLAALTFLGNAWTLDTIQIGNLLQNWHPRLVFLNACRTAAGPPGSAALVLSVADGFLDRGVPAVVSMQGDIQGPAAGDFAARLYAHVWEHHALDEAVRLARQHLYNVGDQWPLPVLSLAAPGDEVLPRERPCRDERDRHIERCEVFRSVRLFSGRSEERRRMRTAFMPVKPKDPRRHLLIVTGGSSLGKSHVAKWCLEELALGGCNVQYVEIGYRAKQTFLDVLVNILDSNSKRGAEPIPRDVFEKFRWDAHCLLAFGATRPWTPGTKVDGEVEFVPEQAKAEDPIGDICGAFMDALKAASANRPLVLLLDQFRHENQVVLSPQLFRDVLWPNVLEPIASGRLPNVRCGVVLLGDDCTLYGISDFVPAKEWVSVAEFKRTMYEELAREMFWYPTDEEAPELPDVIAAVGKRLGASWPGTVLDQLAKAMMVVDPEGKHRRNVDRSR